MNKILRRVGAIAAVTLLSVSAPGVAQAKDTVSTQTMSDCFSGYLCLWQDSYFSGPLGMYNPSTSCYTMGVMNNAVSSIYNRTGGMVRVYDGSGCTGSYSDFGNGDYAGSLSLSGWNDKITSFRRR